MIKAYPSYETEPHLWAMGITAPTTAPMMYAGTGAADEWLIGLHPFFVQPGEYAFTRLSAYLTNLAGAKLKAAFVAIYALEAGKFNLVAFVDATADIQNESDGVVDFDFADGVFSFCAKPGVDYYWGVMLQSNATGTPPGIGQTAAYTSSPNQSYWWEGAAVVTDPGLPAFLDSSSATDSPGSGGWHITGKLFFRTTTRKVFSSATGFFSGGGADSVFVMPHRVEDLLHEELVPACWIVLRSVIIGRVNPSPINDTLDVALCYGDSGATSAVLDTLSVAMLGMGSDTVTFKNGTETVGLRNATQREAGDTLDFGVLTRAANDSTVDNAYWVDRTYGQGPLWSPTNRKDICTISHATVTSGTHADGKLGYDLSTSGYVPVEFLDLSAGTSSTVIDQIEVADRLCVVFGDSNIGEGASAGIPAKPQRLGEQFPLLLEHPLPWWIAGITSNPLAANGGSATAGYARYCNTESGFGPGFGDICDMWDILLFFQMGGNDMKDFSGTQFARNRLVSLLAQRLSEILTDLFAADSNGVGNERNNRAFLFSMPVFRDPGSSQDQREVFIQWSNAVLGLACAWRVPFYDSYYDLCTHDRRSSATPLPPSDGANAGYQKFDGVHYRDPDGAAAVCEKAVVAYQTDRVGGSGFSVY